MLALTTREMNKSVPVLPTGSRSQAQDFYIANLSLGEGLSPIDRTEKISFILRQSYCKKKAWYTQRVYTRKFN